MGLDLDALTASRAGLPFVERVFADGGDAGRLVEWARDKSCISEDAPRESVVLDPGERSPDCGGVLRLVGEGEEDKETIRRFPRRTPKSSTSSTRS